MEWQYLPYQLAVVGLDCVILRNSYKRFISLLANSNCFSLKLDGSLPANPVNDRRVANAVTLKSTFRLP